MTMIVLLVRIASAVTIASVLAHGTIAAPDKTISAPLSPLKAELDPVNGGRFVDGEGREVMLSGVNVNSLGEYWQYDEAQAPNLPFTEQDMDHIQAMGWNLVRLVITWSRVEPEPGVYDQKYLDQIEKVVRQLEARGIYTMIDLHQDAWGPSLAARENENCPEGTIPASGWDGAPAWATLDHGAARCYPDHPLLGEREFSPAVMMAFLSFWEDAKGPGSVGIQTRYHAMLSHLAKRFSPFDAVMGYDVMNEPNAWDEEILSTVLPGQNLKAQQGDLSNFYQRSFDAIRKGEKAAGSPNRLVVIEPSPDWQLNRPGSSVPMFEHDGQIVYSPHIYQGGITPTPLNEVPFERARQEAAAYGGVPVLTGEWGASPERALDPGDNYFERHYAYQDEYRIGNTLWLWHVSCGDPHFAKKPYQGIDPTYWGFYEVECPGTRLLGFRDDYADVMRRPLLRAAPGRISEINWNYEDANWVATGTNAKQGQALELFLHTEITLEAISGNGVESVELLEFPGPGQILRAVASRSQWSLKVVF